ncbi:DNA polymerase III subunit beta [Desulfuromonas versatilis]|uniref:Beta sliding clamp n=1 Tax=Desulfuromonas versatilis TaxID=2802975 RepID=A0ABM8HNB9_9BACT|nr:DNA polymerase III subunit beta [Desulfuromonas versatilis]BCR02939.1 DNA polymerase III subunit beta [Desulfuromonas versatilis]
MQFFIEKEVFLKGLARIQGVVEKRNTIPILSNVLIEARDGQIFLTATDLEVGMRASHPATVETPGRVTVSAKKLYEIIKELPEKEISFLAKDNCWIEIRCGKALFNIVGLSAEEFPYFPQPEKEQFVAISSTLLKEMIDKTAFSISNDETKYNLNGIFFRSTEQQEKAQLTLVATDGHRLSLISRDLGASHIPELQKGVIFPRKGIMELKKMAEEGPSDIHLGFMDNNAVIKKDQTIVVMRLVDGEFPDYSRVIPKANEFAATIPRDLLLHSLRRMSILSSEKSRGVKLFLRTDLLEISSSNPELGDAREDLEIEYQGPELSIGFNARYLMDILQAQDAEKVVLKLKDNLSPGLINPAEETDYLAVVMPMRL